MKTLKDLFLNQLADMYDAERQTAKGLPKLIQAATCSKLKDLLQAHTTETETHVAKLEQVLQSFAQKLKGKTCQVTTDLLADGNEIVAEYKDSPALNAALIAVVQQLEHHEIAAYGALHAWAVQLGNTKAASLLEVVLGEEKAANEALIQLALANANKEALGECGPTEPTTHAKADIKPAHSGCKPVAVPA